MIKTPFDNFNFLKSKFQDLLWVIFGLVALSSTIIFFRQSPQHFLTLIFLSIGIVIVPIFVRIGAKNIKLWQSSVFSFARVGSEEISGLFEKEFNNFQSLKFSLSIGLLFSALGSVVYFLILNQLSSSPLYKTIIALAIILLSTFVCGIGLGSVFDLSKLFWKIGKFPVRIDHHTFGILSSGKKLLFCYFLTSVVWFVYSASAVNWISYTYLPYYFFSIPSLVFIILSFVFALFPLHNRMVEDKINRLTLLEKTLQENDSLRENQYSKERVETIENLTALIIKTNNLPEWPFNFKTLLNLIGSAIFAILPNILGMFISLK